MKLRPSTKRWRSSRSWSGGCDRLWPQCDCISQWRPHPSRRRGTRHGRSESRHLCLRRSSTEGRGGHSGDEDATSARCHSCLGPRRRAWRHGRCGGDSCGHRQMADVKKRYDTRTRRSALPFIVAGRRTGSARMSGSTEAFSRVKIDALLGDAGWHLTDGASVLFEHALLDGSRADYALCDRSGRPLAALEAKRAGIDPVTAQDQGRHYAEQLGVPFVFLSNGEEVWFLNRETDADARKMATFYSLTTDDPPVDLDGGQVQAVPAGGDASLVSRRCRPKCRAAGASCSSRWRRGPARRTPRRPSSSGCSRRVSSPAWRSAERLREFVPALFIKMFGDPMDNRNGWDVCRLGDAIRSHRYERHYGEHVTIEAHGSTRSASATRPSAPTRGDGRCGTCRRSRCGVQHTIAAILMASLASDLLGKRVSARGLGRA